MKILDTMCLEAEALALVVVDCEVQRWRECEHDSLHSEVSAGRVSLEG